METYAIKLANEFSANIIRILLSQEREKWIRHLALHRKLRRSSPGHHSRKRLKRARTQLRYIDRELLKIYGQTIRGNDALWKLVDIEVQKVLKKKAGEGIK